MRIFVMLLTSSVTTEASITQMKFIKVQERTGGINVNIDISGTGNPVLFIHGHMSGGYAWRHQTKDLNDAGFQTIAPDLLGYGESDKKFEFNYGHLNQAIICREVLNKLNISKVDIVAVGFGARIGLTLAIKFPKMVRSLTLVNCVVHESMYNLLGKIAVVQNLKRIALKNKWRSKKGFSLSLRDMSGEDLSDESVDLRWEYYQRENDKEVLIAMQRDANEFLLKDYLSDITCPVHLIRSTNSPLAKIEDAEKLIKELSSVTHNIHIDIIEKGGHFVNETKPKEFNKCLIDFLKTVQS